MACSAVVATSVWPPLDVRAPPRNRTYARARPCLSFTMKQEAFASSMSHGGGKRRFPWRRLETRRRSRATQSDFAKLELRRERGNFKKDVHRATRGTDMPNRDSALPHIS